MLFSVHFDGCIFLICGQFFAMNIVLVLIDVIKDALQPNFLQVEDGRLKALVLVLPGVLFKSKSASTTKKCERGFQYLEKMCFAV